MEADALDALEVSLCYSSSYDTQWDEFWSYVGKKDNPRWTWYLLEQRSGLILAWHNGRRTDEVLSALLVKVEHLPIRCCYTDEWGTYHRLFPQQYLHEVNRGQTWRIERRHLNFRTHLKRLSRRTLCFSKNEQIHDNVIGLYIERYYYRHGQFGRAGAAHQRE